MKKETSVAIASGFILGLVVAFVIVHIPTLPKKGFSLPWQLPKLSFNLNDKPKNVPATPTPKTTFALEISSPADSSIVSSKTITLSGKTSPDTLLIVNTNLEDNVTTSGKTGIFDIELSLSEGTNSIEVHAYPDKNQMPDSKNLRIFYTSEKL